jgi:folate-dependent phosphoribosylglycinamide formyltransferase PurN
VAEQHRPAVIVWGSGSGTTFQAIDAALRDGLVDFDIPLVISDQEDAGIFEKVDMANAWRGRDSQIETMVINRRRYPEGPQPRGQTLAEAEATCEVLRRNGGAVLLLAGCMRILGDPVLDEFGWQPEWADEPDQGKYQTGIINTHPGIVPATADTYGAGPSRRAIELELDESAYTLLGVGGSVDGGPIIIERRFRIPKYRWSTDAELDVAADHLFTKIAQPIEKAYLPFDTADFLIRRSMAQ